MKNRYELNDGTVISGLSSIAKFTEDVPMYTVFLNVDSYANNSRYVVFAEEITTNNTAGRKSAPNTDMSKGVIVVLRQENPDGICLSENEILSAISNALSTTVRKATLFLERLSGDNQ